MRSARLGFVLLLSACNAGPSMGRAPDAATPVDAGGAGPGLDAASSVDGGDGVCADVTVELRRVTPTVMFLVDQSLSMENELGATTRWDAVRDALFGTSGVVTELDGLMRFGLALYSDLAGDAACPMIEQAEPVMGDAPGLASLYDGAAPLGETPTGESIDLVAATLPDGGADPVLLVLATDGNPDRCAAPDGHDDTSRRLSVQAVERARARGITTHVIAVGVGTVAASHLAELARAGTGRPDARYWEAGDPAALTAALREAVRGELSCVFELRGRVDPTQACSGTVSLDGSPLACDGGDGFRLPDESHIELTGSACDALLEGGGALDASFPCDALLI